MKPIAMPVLRSGNWFRNPKKALFAGLAALLVLCAGLGWLFGGGPADPDARVDGRVSPLAAGVDGRVARVLVRENQVVKAGEPLILLDDGYLAARLAEARAGVDAVRAGLSPAALDTGNRGSAAAEEAIRARMQAARDQETAARRDVEQLSAEHARLQLEARRLDALTGARTPSLDRINKARLAELEAREALETAQRRLETLSRARAAADGELNRYRAELAAAARTPADLRGSQLAMREARLREAEQAYAAATISSPVTGQVARIGVSAGAPVRRGQVVAAVVPVLAEDLRITAHFKPSEADSMQPGDSCTVTFPDGPDLKLAGVVESVAASTADAVPATDDSPESLRPRRGIPVRIAIPDYDPASMPLLRVGMKAKVRMGIF